jgi:hypothetical protein
LKRVGVVAVDIGAGARFSTEHSPPRFRAPLHGSERSLTPIPLK